MAEDWGFGAAMKMADAMKGLQDGQAQASDQAGGTVKQAQGNIPGKNEAHRKEGLAKIDLAKARIKMKSAQASIAFGGMRAAITFAVGGVAGYAANRADRGSNLDRAHVIAGNSGIANDRLRAGGSHIKDLKTHLDFSAKFGKATTARLEAEVKLEDFNTANKGALTSEKANERAGLRAAVDDTKQAEASASILAQRFSGILPPDAATLNIMGDRAPDGSFRPDVDAFLESQGMSASDRSMVTEEQKTEIRGTLNAIYEDQQTMAKSGTAGEFVVSHDELVAAKQEKQGASQELQAAHQSGDQTRIQKAEVRDKAASTRLDTAERKVGQTEEAFNDERTKDVGFFQSAIGKALEPFMKELMGQLFGSDSSNMGGLMALAAQYAAAQQSLSQASDQAGSAAKQALEMDMT